MIQTLIPVIGGLIGKAIDKAVPDKDAAEKLKQEVMLEAMKQDNNELQGAIQIITAEVNGESAAQRNWRPHLMYLIMFLLVFNGVLVPLLNVMFGVTIPVLEAWDAIPGKMWNLLMIGLGGYIGSRGVEKSIKNWKGAS